MNSSSIKPINIWLPNFPTKSILGFIHRTFLGFKITFKSITRLNNLNIASSFGYALKKARVILRTSVSSILSIKEKIKMYNRSSNRLRIEIPFLNDISKIKSKIRGSISRKLKLNFFAKAIIRVRTKIQAVLYDKTSIKIQSGILLPFKERFWLIPKLNFHYKIRFLLGHFSYIKEKLIAKISLKFGFREVVRWSDSIFAVTAAFKILGDNNNLTFEEMKDLNISDMIYK